MEMQNMSGYGIKDCLTEAGLRWKCFGKYNKNREFHRIMDKFARDSIRKSTKSGRVAALKRFLNQTVVRKY